MSKAWYQERLMDHLNFFEPLQGSEVIAEREAGALLAIGYEVWENANRARRPRRSEELLHHS